jgi:hypothetical protein
MLHFTIEVVRITIEAFFVLFLDPSPPKRLRAGRRKKERKKIKASRHGGIGPAHWVYFMKSGEN